VNIYHEAAIWVGMALVASVVSVQIAVPVALVEIVVGGLAGNLPGVRTHVTQTGFVTFLASIGSIALTFLAGAEIDPVSLRRHRKASVSIGRCRSHYQYQLPDIAPVQTGFDHLVIGRFGHRVSEPEIKLLLLVLFALGGLATQAGSEAVLPAYLAGLVIAGVFMHDRILMGPAPVDRLCAPHAVLLPARRHTHPRLALVSGAGVIAVLLTVKLISKGIAVWSTAARFRLERGERAYTTLLMATGLTFGSISALFGLTHQLINSTQYTELVTVVVLSAFVPTLIAQQLFQPELVDADEDKAARRDDPTP
jgi:Kef-type K+ transport system membrane component KefB